MGDESNEEDVEEIEGEDVEETEDKVENEDDSSIMELEDAFPDWEPGQEPIDKEQWDDWATQFDYADFADLKNDGFDLHVNWNRREVQIVDKQAQTH
jgi:hypothetical protein